MLIQVSYKKDLGLCTMRELEKYEDSLMAFRADLHITLAEIDEEIERCQAKINEAYA